MLSTFARMTLLCLRPIRRYALMSRDDEDDHDDMDCDSLLWSRELERHSLGDFSMAVVQANEVIEDHSQVETGNGAVFVGVYDGHGGPEASRYISDHLFSHLMRISRERGVITEETLRAAFSATEKGFLTLVRRTRGLKPLIAAAGSCCLVGVIWKGTLLIANVGDSRAVLGSSVSSNDHRSNRIVAEQLTSDHNAAQEEVRQDLRSLHPDDPRILVHKQSVWRIKGIIQINRDAYLKHPDFSLGPSFPRFYLPEGLKDRVLQTSDKFVIFASDGLWEHVSNQQAVEIVNKHPRPVRIARRLVRRAMNIAAKKKGMMYDDLKKVERGVRRFFHDDITVAVIFIDNELLMVEKATLPELSIKAKYFMVKNAQGIARRLVRRAMNIAAKKKGMMYDDLKKVERGVRRFFHDDITVAVIFIDNELLMVEKATLPELSIKGFSHTVGPSKFSLFFS
ncbi:hypothetical protein Bca52824_070015 [Brassica carinata]|uniref:protein-serine/threonine phosphatase n=1 Tax=Brassica carinata TaxID=52824 RepID=A0A8X7U3G2_BRACI|nr:hypothetical protein Bca52824_070015 [Brassica carinata]